MINKPEDMDQVWALNAPVANIINPNAVIPNKIELGWLKEIPPLQWFNWIQNSIGNKCAYLNTVGVMSKIQTGYYKINESERFFELLHIDLII